MSTTCNCRKKRTTCDNNCNFGKVSLDLKPETHRNASDCTCYECMRKETIDYFKTEQIKTITYVLD